TARGAPPPLALARPLDSLGPLAPHPDGKRFIVGHDEIGRWCLADLRHLSERQILVEPLRRQAVDRARQQGNERAPRRIRTLRAACEERRYLPACAGVFENAEVLLRRSKKDRHLVEPDAALRLFQDSADDFDRLASFARCREQADVSGVPPLRRTLLVENVLA